MAVFIPTAWRGAARSQFLLPSEGVSEPFTRDRNFHWIDPQLRFGDGLFGSAYLMPVFLAFVRGHNALEIGMTMLVTGVAQLVTAPIAVALEERVDARFVVCRRLCVVYRRHRDERVPEPAI